MKTFLFHWMYSCPLIELQSRTSLFNTAPDLKMKLWREMISNSNEDMLHKIDVVQPGKTSLIEKLKIETYRIPFSSEHRWGMAVNVAVFPLKIKMTTTVWSQIEKYLLKIPA